MQIDITLKNARVYNIEKADIAVNENFYLRIIDVLTDKVKWFVENDPVLDITLSEDTSEISITAKSPGTSTILIMDSTYKILKTLTINVLSEISPVAVKIEAVAGEPEPK